MLFERHDVKGLAHYSYLVGCPADGRMIVVDPERNIDVYLQAAHRRGLRISHILETHIHADFASGARALSEATGAPVFASALDEGETYEVTFPHRDMREGHVIEIGSVKVEALHTPGHTPEHLSFLVYDRSRSDKIPMLMLSGDFLFVGSVGRPDLLGEEQKRGLAKQMFHTVREKLAALPDGLEIHPAHGAGSMCGSGMSGRPTSTLGFERAANPYLDPSLAEEEFIEHLLGTVPPFPPYYRRMKVLNSHGAPALPARHGAVALSPDRVAEISQAGAIVIDLRDQLAFGGGHIPGSIGIGAGSSLPVWASWLVPYETPMVLVARDEHEAIESATGLSRVGLDDVRGHLEGGIDAWRRSGRDLEELHQVSPRALYEAITRNAGVQVVDVRSDAEWDRGHVEGARHVFGGTIEDAVDQLPERSQPIAIMCGGGYRSTAVASVLRRHGFHNLLNVTGGMNAWKSAGLPTTTAEETVTT